MILKNGRAPLMRFDSPRTRWDDPLADDPTFNPIP